MTRVTSMTFDIFARDHASRTFDDVGDSAERLGRRLDHVSKGAGVAGTAMSGLGVHVSGLGSRLAGVGSMAASLGSSMASLGVTLVTSAVKVGALAGAFASAASSAGGLVAALAPAAGIVAALPGALGLGAAALATFKVALSGVGAAFSAALAGGEQKDFEAAIAGMAPAVQAVARELRNLKPELDGIKHAVQDSLFTPLQGQLSELAAALGGPVRDGMSAVAQQFGLAGAQVAEFARSANSVSAVRSIFSDLRGAVEGLRPALEPLLAGFRDLAVVGSSFSAGLVPGIAAAAARFGEFLSRAAASGQALAWMDNALIVLKALGSIAADVGGILSGVLHAMQAAGTGALGILGQLLDGVNAFVNSAQGQAALVTVFQALHQVGQAFLPVVGALAAGIATLAPVIGQLATAVGPLLAQAISAIAPALAALGPGLITAIGAVGQAVQVLAPALAPLAAALSGVLRAAAPLIPIAAQIATVLAGVLVGALQAIVPALVEFGRAIAPALSALGPGVVAVVQGLAGAVGALLPALLPVGQAIGSVLRALAPLLPLVGRLAALIVTSLADGVQAVIPTVGVLVTAFAQAVKALSPVIPLVVGLAATLIDSLVPALAPLLPQIAQLVTHLVQGLVPAITPLIPIIAQVAGQLGQMLVTALGKVIQALLPVLPVVSQVAQMVGESLLQALIDITPSLMEIIDAFLKLLPTLTPFLPVIGELAKALLPIMAEWIKQLAPIVVELADASVQLLQALIPLIPTIIDLIRWWAPIQVQFIQFAGVILQQLIPAIQWLADQVDTNIKLIVGIFQWLYDTLIGHSIIPDLINGMTKWFRDGVGWIRDALAWFGNLPALMLDWVGRAKDAAVGKFNDLVNTARAIPNAITSALGNLGNLLYDSGRSIIQGMIDGLYSMLQAAYNAAADILNRIRALFPSSPAKEGPFSGRGWTLYSGRALAEGFAKGILAGGAGVAAAMESVLTPGVRVLPLRPSVDLAGQTTIPGPGVGHGPLIENFFAAPNQGPRELAEQIYLLALGRSY